MGEASICTTAFDRDSCVGISGVLAATWSDRKERDLGKPWPTLLNMTRHSWRTREEPLYKKRRERKLAKAADEVIVLMMGMQNNIPGGKDLC